ncbi:hypothetical protein GOBAR_DD12841 [Gossypium barbadense]|nr:hypothetical protein GOBAR_DD12841 [Gossypium barbadense]
MPVAPPIITKCSKKEVNRGAWTDEEDQKLAQVVEIYGPKRWQAVAAKAGSRMQEPVLENCKVSESKRDENSTACFINGDDSLFDSYSEEPLNLEWTSHFFETDELWLN